MGETPQPDEKQVQPKYNSIIWIQFKSGGCTLGGVGVGGSLLAEFQETRSYSFLSKHRSTLYFSPTSLFSQNFF